MRLDLMCGITKRLRYGLIFALIGISSAQNSDQAVLKENPISRLARFINPELAELEDRLVWLESRLSNLSRYYEKPLSSKLGWRSGQHTTDDFPTLTLDLGDGYPLDDVFLVPAQPQLGDNRNFFPVRFRVEAALSEDFSDAQILYETDPAETESQDEFPRRIPARNTDARYLKLTVLSGHRRHTESISALSEFVVVSGGEPVSLAATVTATASLDSPNRWSASYVNDGKTPLGIWEGGKWTKSRGEIFAVPKPKQEATWLMDLKSSNPIDRVILFPYQMSELGGVSAVPNDITISLLKDPDEPTVEVFKAEGGETFAPIIIPCNRTEANFVKIDSGRAIAFGEMRYQMLSEIEVWSLGRNLAVDADITLYYAGEEHTPSPEINDGQANGLEIIPIEHWLRELTERKEIEKALDKLKPLRRNMSTETEINVAWGASIAIGLTLLIPIAFVERRRLVSRKQIDSLRKRIASDLHDDIGSNLGSISLIARSAKRDLKNLKDPEDLADDLDEMEIIARESSLAMRDIVWLLERRQDSIGDFVQRMRDTAARLLRDLDYEISCSSNRTAAKMSLDAKRHLFLFYKESLHNILKHSKATKVKIHIYDSRDSLVMEIEDNGKGIPMDGEAGPAAVRKLTDRAAVLEAQLDIDTKPDAGTHLRLTVKRSNLIAANNAA